MPHLTAAQRHQLLDALLALPNSHERAVRNTWLHDLPPSLRKNIARSDIPGTDVENILVTVADWDEDGTTLGQLLATAGEQAAGSAPARTLVTLAARLGYLAPDPPAPPPTPPPVAAPQPVPAISEEQRLYRDLNALDDTDWERLLFALGEDVAALPGLNRAAKTRNLITKMAGEPWRQQLVDAVREAILAMLLAKLAAAPPPETWFWRIEPDDHWDWVIDLGERILTLAPQQQGVRIHTAAGYAQRGRHYRANIYYDNAITDQTRSIELDPQPDYYRERAVTYRALEDYDRAIDDCTQAINRAQPASVYYFERGLTYREKGDLENARQDFKLAEVLPGPEAEWAREQLLWLQPPWA